jgi:hypothetical protein
MKNKYIISGNYLDVNEYDKINFGKYIDSSDYYNSIYVNFYKEYLETSEEKSKREAKEKAERRNNKIDQILPNK